MPETARDPLDTAVAAVLDEIAGLRDERDYYLGLLITVSLNGLGYGRVRGLAPAARDAEIDRLRATYRETAQRHDADSGWMGETVGSYRRLARGRT